MNLKRNGLLISLLLLTSLIYANPDYDYLRKHRRLPYSNEFVADGLLGIPNAQYQQTYANFIRTYANMMGWDEEKTLSAVCEYTAECQISRIEIIGFIEGLLWAAEHEYE